jgi:hypothetical protein
MSALTFSTSGPRVEDNERTLLARLVYRQFPTETTVALASASRTATTFSSSIDTTGYRGIAVVLVWTTTDPTQTLQLGVLTGVIFSSDMVTGLTSALAVTSTARRTLMVYPGIRDGTTSGQGTLFPGALANLTSIAVYHGNANPITYEVRYILLP